MRAAVLEEFGKPLVVEEVALRPPGAGEVIVKIEATSVCITDAFAAHGLSFVPQPVVQAFMISRVLALDEVNDACRAAENREVIGG